MKTLVSILFFCLAFSLMITGQTTPKEKLNNAIYQEEINGDLEKALELYEALVKEYTEERTIVAEALYRIGLTNEKLGTQKAKEYYEKVVSGYTDQPEMVKLAQARLNRIINMEKAGRNLWLAELEQNEDEGIYIVNMYDKGANMRDMSMLDHPSLLPDETKLIGIDYSEGQNVALYDLNTKEIQLVTKYDWSTKGHGWAYYPVASPDGKEVVYMWAQWEWGPTDFAMHVCTTDGESRPLLKNSSNMRQIVPREWSKDGNYILTFVQDTVGYFTIGLTSVKEGKFKPLHKTQWTASLLEGTVSKGGASLSPDGKNIVFADGPGDNLDLYIIDSDGGTPVLLSAYPGNEYAPLWSPDGKHIVFIRETKKEALLYAVELEDGKPVKQPFVLKGGMQNANLCNWTEHGITCLMSVDLHDIYTLALNPETGVPTGDPVPLQYSPTGSNIQPIWSHDGKYLAFVTYGDIPKIVLLPSDGSEPRNYPIEAPGFWEFSLSDLCWSPDDSGISFSVSSAGVGPLLYKLNLASGEWQHWELAFPGWTRTAWGPDMNTFVYARHGTPENGAGLYLFNVETGESKQIYKPDFNEENTIFHTIRFSHNKRWLACDKNSPNGGGWKILLVDMESGESRIFAEKYNFVSFSPDGPKILAGGQGKATIFSIEGKILQQYNSFMENFPKGTRLQSVDWSPDGKQLVFGTRNWIDATNLIRNVLK